VRHRGVKVKALAPDATPKGKSDPGGYHCPKAGDIRDLLRLIADGIRLLCSGEGTKFSAGHRGL